ncbi:hypothetical protein HG826_08110 [Streptomyces sp. GMY01]|nr:hypothetical protein [Streptomyces sp. GMY02]
MPSQAVQGSGVPWGSTVAPRPLAGAAEQGTVEGAGGVRGLGGVLGHVGGHGLIGEFGAGAEGGDLAYVELFAPAEFAFPNRIRGDSDPDPRGSGAGSLGEYGDGGVGRRGLAAAVGAVESDDGVEVDQAALLVLGDLGEGDPQDRAGRARLLPARSG